MTESEVMALIDRRLDERVAELLAARDGWLTIEQASAAWGVPPATLRKRARRGQVEARREGRWYVRR